MHDGPSSRNKAAFESMNDDQGNAMAFRTQDTEPDDIFLGEPASRAVVKELTDEQRARSERQRLLDMREKYGELGPGGETRKSLTTHRYDEMMTKQNIDGLPWEVRWRKETMVSPEEVIGEVRDRFELNYADPIEREKQWYLHWKDRDYSMAADRQIWPQGYTDYLDKYDEFGRRRVLPSDQKWSDSSWKHLSDVYHRERLHMMDGLERKSFLETLRGKEKVLELEEAVLKERADMEQAVIHGVLDLSPDQQYEKLAGTADPKAIAEVKGKIALHGVRTLQHVNKQLHPSQIDPVTSLPKAGIEPLSTSGLTVEQAVAVAYAVHDTVDKKLDMIADSATNTVTAGIGVMREQLEMGRRVGGRAVHAAVTEKAIETARIANGEHLVEGAPRIGDGSAADPLGRIEGGLLEQNDPNPSLRTAPDGFMDTLPASASADLGNEEPMHGHHRKPSDVASADLDEWYENNVAQGEQPFTEYGMTRDPIESAPVFVGGNGTSAFGDEPRAVTAATNPYLKQPKSVPRIRGDRLSYQGVSTFDQGRYNKEGAAREMQSEMKPLPLYRNVNTPITPETGTAHSHSPLESAEEATRPASSLTRRQRRLALEKQKQMTLDKELMLPDLPWESGVVEDNRRGIAEVDKVPFDRSAMDKVYKAYRDFLFQTLYEYSSIAKNTQDGERLSFFLTQKIETVRKGVVGDHPKIDDSQLEVIRRLFESNLLRLQSDWCESNDHEKAALLARSDEAGKSAIAKAKVLGPSMTNFLHESAAAEQEEVKNRPFQRNVAYAGDKAFNPVTKPFVEWFSAHFLPFQTARFESDKQIMAHATAVLQALASARDRIIMPRTDPSNPQLKEEHFIAVRDAFSNWAKGLVHFASGKHNLDLMRRYANSTFRSQAENEFGEANDHFFAAYNCSGKGKLCSLPVPESEPIFYYDDTSFGAQSGVMEIPIHSERVGDIETAENGWALGSNAVWYPAVDETEIVLFKERRGLFSEALQISDRCLDNLNKKTHPSVHPFPEKAHRHLEGAPLTRETAEHLWMRYMGMVYWTHAGVHERLMQFATARELRKKSLNFLYAAVELARKSLPPSWKAPLVTKAIYLMRSQSMTEDDAAHIADVEAVITSLYEVELDERKRIAHVQQLKRDGLPTDGQFLSSTAHWVDPITTLPYRVALVAANIDSYRAYIGELTNETCPPISDAVWEKATAARFAGEDPKKTIPEIARFEAIYDKHTEECFGQKVMKWREMEEPGSFSYHALTAYYFGVKGRTSADPAETEKLWQIVKPSLDYFYTNVCLGNTRRGEVFIHKMIRTMFLVLSASDSKDHKLLLKKEMQNFLDKIPDTLDKDEMTKSIVSLEAHLADPRKPLYCYLSNRIREEMEQRMAIDENPDLLVTTRAGDQQGKEVKEQISRLRASQ